MKTTAGRINAMYHEDFDQKNFPNVKDMIFTTRKLAKEAQDYQKEDHTHAFFITAGLTETVSPEKLFLTHHKEAFDGHPDYVRERTGAEIIRDDYTIWRESANRLGYKV
jgi:hypothetical protein